MKTIRLVGGLTRYSSIDYYRIINQKINQRPGDDIAASIIVNSVNYRDIRKLTQAGDWKGYRPLFVKRLTRPKPLIF